MPVSFIALLNSESRLCGACEGGRGCGRPGGAGFSTGCAAAGTTCGLGFGLGGGGGTSASLVSSGTVGVAAGGGGGGTAVATGTSGGAVFLPASSEASGPEGAGFCSCFGGGGGGGCSI